MSPLRQSQAASFSHNLPMFYSRLDQNAGIDLMQVQKLQPYVWLYCQNENRTVDSDMAPLLKYGGQVVHLENVGRESHAFLQHITGHYGDLADHTLFSQDIPEAILLERFEASSSSASLLPVYECLHMEASLTCCHNAIDRWRPVVPAIPFIFVNCHIYVLFFILNKASKKMQDSTSLST